MTQDKAPVYLDYNATSPLRADAKHAALLAMAIVGNASSVHAHGRRARCVVEDSREQIGALVGAPPAWIAFTSGGTEANALAFRAASQRSVYVSAIEHQSVLGQHPNSREIAVTKCGVVDIDALEQRLAKSAPAFVSVMLANNETGAIQPVERVAEVCHQYGAIVHCDAVQGPGKIPLDFRGLGVDLMSISAHKIGGLPGCGALIADPDIDMQPLLAGGGQERGRRAGTENVVGIAAFGAAAGIGFQPQEYERLKRMRDRIEGAIMAIETAAVVYAGASRRLPNTSCIQMPGVTGETQVMAFDLLGISISAGAACSSGKVRKSHVLKAMGATDASAQESIRVSLGWDTTEEACDRFIDAWRTICMRGRGSRQTDLSAA